MCIRDRVWPSLTTVWGMSSPFVQVICVPAFTVSVAGEKLKLSILTSVFPALAAAAVPGATAGRPIKAVISENAKQRIQSVFSQPVLLILVLIISAPLFPFSAKVCEGFGGPESRFTLCLTVQNVQAAVLFQQFLHRTTISSAVGIKPEPPRLLLCACRRSIRHRDRSRS